MTTEPISSLVQCHEVEDVTVVRFTRRTVLDPMLIESIGDCLLDLVVGQGRTLLAIDFTRVESVTTAMLGKFVSLHSAVGAAGGKLVFCGVDSFLKQIFTICNLPQAIPICADENEALQVLRA